MYTIHIYEKITDNFAGKINVIDGRTPNEVMSVFGLTASFEVDGKQLDGNHAVSDKTDVIAYVVAQGGKGAGLGQLLIGGTLIGASTFFTGGLATGLMTAGIGNSVSGGLTYLLGGASYQSDNSLVSGSNYEPPKLNLKNEIAKYDEPIGEIFGTHLIVPKMLGIYKKDYYDLSLVSDDEGQPIRSKYYFSLGKTITNGLFSYSVNNVWFNEQEIERLSVSNNDFYYEPDLNNSVNYPRIERFEYNHPFELTNTPISINRFRNESDNGYGNLKFSFFIPNNTSSKFIKSFVVDFYLYDDSDSLIDTLHKVFNLEINEFGIEYALADFEVPFGTTATKFSCEVISVRLSNNKIYGLDNVSNPVVEEYPSQKIVLSSVDFENEGTPLVNTHSSSFDFQLMEFSFSTATAVDFLPNEEDGLSISCEVQALSYIKTGVNTYTYGYTNNPAGALLKVLKGSSNFKPVDDANIDYDSIDDFWDHCETNGFEFNYVASKTRKVSELIKLILASGMASYSTPEGVFKVVIDKAGKQTTGIVSNRNSFSASCSQNTNEKTIPEAYKVSYIDELYRWKENEFIVYADGFDSSNATNIIPFSMAGVTKQTQISYIAKVMLASARLRNETYKVNLSLDNMYLSRGDIVSYQEQFLQSQLYSARIRSLFINPTSGLVIGFEMDDYYDFGDFDHSVVIRNNTGNAVQIVNITQRNENTNLIGFDSAELSTSLVNEGNLFTIGIRGSEVTKCMVADIKPNSDLTASVMLMPYAEEIFSQTGDSNTSIVNVPNNKNSIINTSVQIQINNIIDGIREENNLITESEEDILTEDGELILV